MAEIQQLDKHSVKILGKRRGFEIFTENPSNPTFSSRQKIIPIGGGNKILAVDDGTKEVIGTGTLGFINRERADKTRFIKVYEEGMKKWFLLSSSATSVLGVVYKEVLDNPNTDRVELNMFKVQKCGLRISDRTYQRSVRELLDKNFLFMSPSESVYFINVNYIYNGNRLYMATITDLDEEGALHAPVKTIESNGVGE